MRVPGVAVALWLVASLATGQSLGEAARKQARKRSTGTAAARVYTDTDLRPHGLPDTAPARPASGVDTPAPVTVSPAAVTPLLLLAPTAPSWPPTATDPAATTDPVRAQLNREEAARRAREQTWKQRASQALARIEITQREYDASCGRSVFLVAGG